MHTCWSKSFTHCWNHKEREHIAPRQLPPAGKLAMNHDYTSPRRIARTHLSGKHLHRARVHCITPQQAGALLFHNGRHLLFFPNCLSSSTIEVLDVNHPATRSRRLRLGPHPPFRLRLSSPRASRNTLRRVKGVRSRRFISGDHHPNHPEHLLPPQPRQLHSPFLSLPRRTNPQGSFARQPGTRPRAPHLTIEGV